MILIWNYCHEPSLSQGLPVQRLHTYRRRVTITSLPCWHYNKILPRYKTPHCGVLSEHNLKRIIVIWYNVLKKLRVQWQLMLSVYRVCVYVINTEPKTEREIEENNWSRARASSISVFSRHSIFRCVRRQLGYSRLSHVSRNAMPFRPNVGKATAPLPGIRRAGAYQAVTLKILFPSDLASITRRFVQRAPAT